VKKRFLEPLLSNATFRVALQPGILFDYEHVGTLVFLDEEKCIIGAGRSFIITCLQSSTHVTSPQLSCFVSYYH
jgi:hypothetical protein